MISNFKHTLSKNIVNIPGWRTTRKIVVIESDDWGSIRTPSKRVYDLMVKQSLIHEKYVFARFDALASEHDLSLLFETLNSYKDHNNNHPVFTANCVMANPDFEKIRKHNYQQYFFEPFTTTLTKYPKHANSFEIWKQGIDSKVFFPQLHGREHINVARWMKRLAENHPQTRAAFDYETFQIHPDTVRTKSLNFAPALDMDDVNDLNQLETIVDEGMKMFQTTFGYKSDTFIAPNYTWHPFLEKKLLELGIKYFQSSKMQNIPQPGKEAYKKKFIYTGKKNNLGPLYTARNVYFEPALNPDTNLINSCLNSISNAFFWGKPAIISTHRLNYVGYIDEQNRDKNLILLKSLLSKILEKWPEVEFMNSAQLGDLISGNE